ncbi:cell death abnormality protein 1-like [Ostrea edulis]|uniref:cell death abnormality protein 1-like n=1 Tax=Ostrea edulis TaxID=37623 RepID=UPI0024AE9C45|nr:cell death abnormality protein 1-like [Ostrea edulis]
MIFRKCVVSYFIVFSVCIQGTYICNQTGPADRCCEHYRWNETTGECTPCPQGYTGRTCDAKCPYPTYGVACQSVCACQRMLCNVVTGCPVTAGTTMETQTIYKRLSTVDYKRDIRNTVMAGNEVGMKVIS